MRRSLAALCSVRRKICWSAARCASDFAGDDSSSSSATEKPRTLAHIDEHFDSIPHEERNKRSFLASIAMFHQGNRQARGHVEFINSALKHLEEYRLHKDLDTYKALLDVFPKGPFIARNRFQKMFLHYPLQQNCCVKLLDQMEWFGVQPDKEVYDLVVNAFGQWSLASKKMKRMMYWMPKLKHTNKYLDRRTVEGRTLPASELAYIALKMISRDPGTAVSFVNIRGMEPSSTDQWVVSAQSPLQKKLIEGLEEKSTLYVDGPTRVYVSDRVVHYVQLSADPNPTDYFDNFRPNLQDENNFEDWHSSWEAGNQSTGDRSIHEQKDETILALAVLGCPKREWAAAWVNHLAEENPALLRVRFLFRIREIPNEVYVPSSTDGQSSHRYFV